MFDTKFLPKFSITVILTFILFTVVGTLLHEMGHIAAAKSVGYRTQLHYGSMNYYHDMKNDSLYIEVMKIFKEKKDSIRNGLNFKQKNRYQELKRQIEIKYPRNKKYKLWVTLGGPLQTILTSFIGLFILYYRKSKSKKVFKILDWLGVFLALFILREVFDFIKASYSFFFKGKESFRWDEFRISEFLGLHGWTIPIITFIIGIIISIYIVFKVIPFKYRFTFIISGFLGGILGFIIWFRFLGKIILP